MGREDKVGREEHVVLGPTGNESHAVAARSNRSFRFVQSTERKRFPIVIGLRGKGLENLGVGRF
jgi:hypothetical protein